MTEKELCWNGRVVADMNRDELLVVVKEQAAMLHEAREIYTTARPLLEELVMRVLADGQAVN